MDDSSAPTSPEKRDASIPRLTLRLILRDLAERFFSLDRGWLRTATELFTGPGAVIQRYIAGDRKSYANPFAYLLVGSAISILLQKTLGIGEVYLRGAAANPELSTRQFAFAHDIQELLMQYMLYITLGTLIPFAVFLRILFRRSGYNIAEMMVFALYTGGHLALLEVVAIPLIKVLSIHPAFIELSIALIYVSYGAASFFGRHFTTVIKVCLAYATGTFVYVAVVLSTMLLYVVFFLSTSYTSLDDWNVVTAAEQGHAAVLKSLLEDGQAVDLTLQRTALHAAAETGQLEIVEVLLANGANINAEDHAGRSPIFYAMRTKHRNIALRLAEAGANLTLRSKDGTTLLMLAANIGDADLARQLIAAGCDVNAVRLGGERITALMEAATDGNEDLVRLLLKHGADTSVTNSEGKTAIDYADSKVVEELLRGAQSP